jgi:phosphomannomutase
MTFKHEFAATSLREYDIRGIVGESLNEADAFAIGRVFASVILESGGRTIAVGRDGRLSSPALEAALFEGLVASGAEVISIGQGPTPMLYFAAFTTPTDGAVMVTGSHNPPNYNGFKMLRGKKPFFGKDILRLGARAAAGEVLPEAKGSVTKKDVSDAYIARLAQDWDAEKPLSVIWDNGNGAAGDILVRLVKTLPGKHKILNAKIDGNFPAHHPDPTVPKNLEELIAAVKREGADVGVAFDGDADRIGLVDNEGHILFGDQFLILMARDVLRDHPGATIIADVKASQILFDEIGKAGGKPLMWKTGHSLIKSKMAETGAPLAGEMSGHIFYNDKWYGFDDALYAAIRVLSSLTRGGQTLAEFRASLPTVINTPELRFDCDEDKKFKVVAEVAERLKAAGATVSDTDGVRVTTQHGWWLLRASNTQAVLVARAESTTEQGLSHLKSDLAAQLAASGLAPDFSGANAGH